MSCRGEEGREGVGKEHGTCTCTCSSRVMTVRSGKEGERKGGRVRGIVSKKWEACICRCTMCG